MPCQAPGFNNCACKVQGPASARWIEKPEQDGAGDCDAKHPSWHCFVRYVMVRLMPVKPATNCSTKQSAPTHTHTTTNNHVSTIGGWVDHRTPNVHQQVVHIAGVSSGRRAGAVAREWNRIDKGCKFVVCQSVGKPVGRNVGRTQNVGCPLQ